MMLFSLFPRNFAAWTGILQRLKTNSGKDKRKQHTGFPSPWAVMILFFFFFFEHEVLGEHTSWLTWFMKACRGHSIQVPPGKLISLMFLNAFCWLLPWGQAELRTQLVVTAGVWWRGYGLFLQNLLSTTKPLTSCHSQTLHWKLVQALRVCTKPVSVRFPVLGQNSTTLAE